MAQSALVTGSSGFVGGHVVRRLTREGYRVTGLDLTAGPDLPEETRQVTLDLRDRAAVRALLARARPELIVHAAAQASVSVSMREPRLDVETNALGTLELALEAAACGVRRLVFLSSGGAIYGEPAQLPATEETPLRPRSIYGASKAAAEHYLAVVAAEHGLEVSVLRPSNIYGPGQDPGGEAGVVAIFTERMLRGEPVTIFGDGRQTRDYVFIEDLVEAVVRAADGPPGTCNIGTAAEVSTGQIFRLLAALTGYAEPPIHAPERAGDIARISLAAERARALWGWRPEVSLEEGAERTVEWFRGQLGAG